jgi:hypothetical protein
MRELFQTNPAHLHTTPVQEHPQVGFKDFLTEHVGKGTPDILKLVQRQVLKINDIAHAQGNLFASPHRMPAV